MPEDIYDTDKRLERLLEKIKALGSANSKLILDFHEKYSIKNKLSKMRQLKLLNTLVSMAKTIEKPLNQLTEKGIEGMNVFLAKDGYAKNTINDFRAITKLWLRYLGEKENWDLIHSKELKAISRKNGEDQLDPDVLPTDEEVLQLFNVLPLKFRAFTALTDGAGLRIGEASMLLRKNLHFEEDKSVTVNYTGKTGRNSVRIHAGLAHYLLEWFNAAPQKEDDAPLFGGRASKFMNYNTFRKALTNAADKTGILGKRKVNPHIFRHRHATWALLNMPPVLAKKRVWGNAATKMDKIYGHFTKQQENEAYLSATGHFQAPQKQQILLAKVCFKCKASFAPNTEICPNCSIYLDPKKISEELQKKRNFESEIAELKADMEKILVFLAKEKGLIKEKEVVIVGANKQ